MIKQNDFKLRKEIQVYGCNLLAHLAAVRMDWQSEEVESLYQNALKAGIIDANCSVQKPNELLALAGSGLRQIGGLVLATNETWGVRELEAKVRYRIARWAQRNSIHQHFTLFNLKGEIYDPYDANIASYRLEKLALIGYQLYG